MTIFILGVILNTLQYIVNVLMFVMEYLERNAPEIL